MRLSWHANTGIAVFSIWQGGTCTGTFRLPMDDLSRLVDSLHRGMADGHSSAPGSGPGTNGAPSAEPFTGAMNALADEQAATHDPGPAHDGGTEYNGADTSNGAAGYDGGVTTGARPHSGYGAEQYTGIGYAGTPGYGQQAPGYAGPATDYGQDAARRGADRPPPVGTGAQPTNLSEYRRRLDPESRYFGGMDGYGMDGYGSAQQNDAARQYGADQQYGDQQYGTPAQYGGEQQVPARYEQSHEYGVGEQYQDAPYRQPAQYGQAQRYGGDRNGTDQYEAAQYEAAQYADTQRYAVGQQVAGSYYGASVSGTQSASSPFASDQSRLDQRPYDELGYDDRDYAAPGRPSTDAYATVQGTTAHPGYSPLQAGRYPPSASEQPGYSLAANAGAVPSGPYPRPDASTYAHGITGTAITGNAGAGPASGSPYAVGGSLPGVPTFTPAPAAQSRTGGQAYPATSGYPASPARPATLGYPNGADYPAAAEYQSGDGFAPARQPQSPQQGYWDEDQNRGHWADPGNTQSTQPR